MNKLEFSEGKNPFGNELVRNNIESCLKRNLPDLFIIPSHAGSLNIVGGAPSLTTQLNKLHITKSPIWAVNGACKYLLEQGIKPKSMVLLDSSECIVNDLPNIDMEYLIASQVSPLVFDALKGKNVKVWHAMVQADEASILKKYRKTYTMLGGGCGVLLRCLNLGYMLGFRSFNLFGFDCSFQNKSHVYDCEETKSIENVEIIFNGKKYITQYHYARQINDFVDMINYFNSQIKQGNMDAINITLNGTGLAQDVGASLGLEVNP